MAAKTYAWHVIKIDAIISVPFTSSLIFYSADIMQLIGQNYIQGTLSLQILLLSTLPAIVLTGIDTLVYSYGNYRQSLAIGLTLHIPRAVLYFLLVPIFGSSRAALGYIIGSFVGFGVSVFIAKKIKMRISWKFLAFIIAIPISLSLVLSVLNVNYILGIIISTFLTYPILIKSHVMAKRDIADTLSILPSRISIPMIKSLNKLDERFGFRI